MFWAVFRTVLLLLYVVLISVWQRMVVSVEAVLYWPEKAMRHRSEVCRVPNRLGCSVCFQVLRPLPLEDNGREVNCYKPISNMLLMGFGCHCWNYGITQGQTGVSTSTSAAQQALKGNINNTLGVIANIMPDLQTPLDLPPIGNDPVSNAKAWHVIDTLRLWQRLYPVLCRMLWCCRDVSIITSPPLCNVIWAL